MRTDPSTVPAGKCAGHLKGTRDNRSTTLCPDMAGELPVERTSLTREIDGLHCSRSLSRSLNKWLCQTVVLIGLFFGAASAASGQACTYVYGNAWYNAPNPEYPPTAAQACTLANGWDFSGDVYVTDKWTLGALTFGSPATNNAIYACNGIDAGCGPNGCYSEPTQTISVGEQSICPDYFVDATPQIPQVCTGDCTGDPINPAIGNVYTSETDFSFASPSPIKYQRFYNSADTTGADNVPGWRHSYDRYISIITQTLSTYYPPANTAYSSEYPTQSQACENGFGQIQSAVPGWGGASATFSGGVCILTTNSGTVQIGTLPIYSTPVAFPSTLATEYDLVRDDGQILRFTVQGSAIVPPVGISIQLAVTGSGFTVTDDDDNVETYNIQGVLQSITSRSGIVQTIAYDSNGLFLSVTDSFGNSLSVLRNTLSQITSVTGGRDGRAFLDSFRGRDKCNSAGYAAAASG